MLTSSPAVSPEAPRRRHKPVVATPQTSQALSKSHRLLRPLKSKLVSLRQFHDSNPSTTRVETIWLPQSWPPSTRNTAKSYGGRRKRTRSNNNASVDDDTSKAAWEGLKISNVEALAYAKSCSGSVTVSNMYTTLHSSYRVFLQQLSGYSLGSLASVATYTLGTWTYLYEQQSGTQPDETPSDDPVLTLDDVLLEYLPPTHPHLPLLLGYTIALLSEYADVIRHLLPSLILLTHPVSRRATIELVHVLFSVAGTGWEDFSLCMMISRLVGREDEYLLWLSRNMSISFIQEGGLGHLLRLGRDYPSFTPTVVRAVKLCIPQKRKPIDPEIEPIITELIQHVCTYSLQSQSKHLIPLVSLLPTQQTPLPSLALLVNLTLQSIIPDYPSIALHPLTKRTLSFSPLRHVLSPSLLKTHITTLLAIPSLAPLAIAVAREWKDHVNYDDDPDDLESTWEFLERVEREYLEDTEGVKWRFEDILAEWIGEWPNGRELGSSKIPKRGYIPIQEEDEDDMEDGEEEEFGGSLVKKFIPRSGLVLDTPIVARKVDPKTERKVVLERLFRLSSIGRTVRRTRIKSVQVELDETESFLERLGKRKEEDMVVQHIQKAPVAASRRKRIVSDTEESDVDSDVQVQSEPEVICRKRGKRRKFGNEDTDGSAYEGSDLENQSVYSETDDDDMGSDDELSISIDPNRSALRGITINRKPTRSHHKTNKMLIRESSPVLLEDASDDELAL